MKSIIFRPLRRIKKTGKITVASYLGWNRVMTADYNKFNLVINDEYKKFPKDEFVYDHNGDLLFFFTYNPADVPVYDAGAERIINENWLDELHENKQPFGIRWDNSEGHVNYNAPGMDCQGTPTFSHYTSDYIADYIRDYYKTEDFEVLTVGTVVKWFGWFLWNLNNSYLKIGR